MAAVQPAPARAGHAGTGDLAAEVAALQQLDAAALRRRWRDLVGGTVPADLGRPLMLRVLAYRLQAQRLGDLDRASLRALAALAGPAGADVSDGCDGSDGDDASRDPGLPAAGGIGGKPDASAVGQHTRPAPTRTARPGTVLVREHGGVPHRVMVLDDGVSWNGKTYDSLSQVAFAITGTKWNGPRFFGLRDAPARDKGGKEGSKRPGRPRMDAGAAAVGRSSARRAARAAPTPSRGAAP